MSEQPGTEQRTPRDDDDTTLAAGVAGPSGTGEQTEAGADPDAPSDGDVDAASGSPS